MLDDLRRRFAIEPVAQFLDRPHVPQYPSTIALGSINSTNGFRLDGGTRAALAGDVNGDGFNDYIIANVPPGGAPVPFFDSKAWVVFGGSAKLAAFDASDGASDGNINLAAVNGTNGFQVGDFTVRDEAGFSIAGMGDINHDGFADVVAPSSPNQHAP